MINRRNFRKGERGQVLALCALFMVVLLLFVGLAIDFGMAYVTKAQLGKAADAAALTAARYSAMGKNQAEQLANATQLANAAFAMNYNSSSPGYSGNAVPTPVVTPTTCPDPIKCPTDSGTLWSVTATATNQTLFAKLLPGFSTVNVASSATSLARTVEMTLVLDRSSSMQSDGGSTYLPGAVNSFINYFNDTTDSVALVYFASQATTAMQMQTGSFQSTISGDAGSLPWGGHTFSDDALQKAFTQELTPVKGNVQKVVVFFTDGGANMIQGTVTCTSGSPGSGKWNFGGEDPGSSGSSLPANAVDFLDPTTTKDKCIYTSGNCCVGTFPSASVAGLLAPAWSSTGPSVTPWTGGTPTTINHDNVRADAFYRAIGDAIAMRLQGITVYAIGLGSAPDPVDPQFLCQVANDPCNGTNTNYNAALPTGVYQSAPTGQDLDAAFQKIASIIRLRLTQ